MYYKTENPHGGDIYDNTITCDFSANVNPYGAPEAVLDAARRAVGLSGNYPDPYCRTLVRAIAAHESIPEDYVFVGNGASEVIYSFCMAGGFRKAVIAVPTFVEYASALQNAGCQVIPWRMKKENGFLPDNGLVDFLIEQRPDVCFLCSPNNPTGRTVPAGLLKKILDVTSVYGIRLFVDECFYEISDAAMTLKDELAGHPNLFLLRAFTKSFALAGLRIGYCLCSDQELLRKMSTHTVPWSVSTPAQMAAEAALKEDAYLDACRQKIAAERDRLARELKDRGLSVYPSEVNFLFFEARPDLHLLLKEKGIAVRSCANYDGLRPGYFRIAVKKREDNDRFISALDLVL